MEYRIFRTLVSGNQWMTVAWDWTCEHTQKVLIKLLICWWRDFILKPCSALRSMKRELLTLWTENPVHRRYCWWEKWRIAAKSRRSGGVCQFRVVAPFAREYERTLRWNGGAVFSASLGECTYVATYVSTEQRNFLIKLIHVSHTIATNYKQSISISFTLGVKSLFQRQLWQVLREKLNGSRSCNDAKLFCIRNRYKWRNSEPRERVDFRFEFKKKNVFLDRLNLIYLFQFEEFDLRFRLDFEE